MLEIKNLVKIYPGPVTALWTMDETSAVAVARDVVSGEYAAYRLAVSCSR